MESELDFRLSEHLGMALGARLLGRLGKLRRRLGRMERELGFPPSPPATPVEAYVGEVSGTDSKRKSDPSRPHVVQSFVPPA